MLPDPHWADLVIFTRIPQARRSPQAPVPDGPDRASSGHQDLQEGLTAVVGTASRIVTGGRRGRGAGVLGVPEPRSSAGRGARRPGGRAGTRRGRRRSPHPPTRGRRRTARDERQLPTRVRGLTEQTARTA